MIENEEDHFFGKVALKALIIKGNTVLLVRHVGSQATWELPGGRLEKAEDPVLGLAREIKEELGVVIAAGEVVSVEQFVMKRTGEAHLAIVYRSTLVDEGVGLLPETSEIHETA